MYYSKKFPPKELIIGFVVLALLFAGVSKCIGQAPKGANKISIKNDRTKQLNFDTVMTVLLDKGFEPVEVSKEYFTIKTSPKSMDKLNAEYYFFIRCKDNEIIITGQFKANIEMNFGGATATASYEPIVNKGMKGSMYKEAFYQMDALAVKIASGIITYQID